ncbi:MAG: glycosyl hydrolase [Rhodoglobus sp.]
MGFIARPALAIVAIAALVLLSACTTGADSQHDDKTGVLPEAKIGPFVAALPERALSGLNAARLADGLIPPTNKWFSGMVFGDTPMPVFPLPLSFQLTAGGFDFGVPTVASNSAVITGGFAPAVGVDMGADSQVVVAYDEASVTVAQRSGDTELGRTLIAEGSPFVTFTASSKLTAHLGNDFGDTDGVPTTTVGATTYGLVTTGTLAGGDLQLDAGQTATWFAVADGGSLADFAAAARHPVTSTTVTYSLDAGSATTTIHYQTADGASTIVAAMPHQSSSLAKGTTCANGDYASIYGELTACSVSDLSWSVPAVTPSGSIDLSGLDTEDKTRLAQQVAADFAVTGAQPADTYYGGKWLYRLVNLMDIARQVGANDVADQIRDRAVGALDDWMDPAGCTSRDDRCFVYDSTAKGVVGLAPSFGSEQFNDHHFHYGYFLYSAGVLAANDAKLATKWEPVMDLLAADLATDGASTLFPQRRVFDAYAGHSWASGTSPFADGNNQESSSEAVSAWNGLALWATASGQKSLNREATWMLSSEAGSALAYWTNFPRNAAVYKGFDHAVTSIDWGAKRDYATWFSPEPSAMLGILVLPMSPVAGYLGADPQRVRENLAEAAPNGYDVVFGDYLLMYSSLAGPSDAAAALAQVATLNEDRIDDGDSRSYLLAWIMSKRG